MTKDEFKKLFQELDGNEYKLLEPTIEYTYDLQKEIEYLSTLPQIIVKPDMPELQRITEAAKQKQKLLQIHKENVRLLLSALRKGDLGGDSPLFKMLNEFASKFN